MSKKRRRIAKLSTKRFNKMLEALFQINFDTSFISATLCARIYKLHYKGKHIKNITFNEDNNE